MGWIERTFGRSRTINDLKFPRVPLPELHPNAGETICVYSCQERHIWKVTYGHMPTERQVVAERCPACDGASRLGQVDFHWENPAW
jgi:hypothetical protein